MRQLSFLFVLLCFLSTSFSCSFTRCIKGEGTISSKVIELPPFKNIKSIGAVDIVLSEGPQKIRVEGYSNVLDRPQFSTEGNTLIIDAKDGCYFNTALSIKISVPGIDNISSTGASDIIIRSLQSDGTLTIKNSGSGDIDIYDLSDVIEIKINSDGSGNITAHNTYKCNTFSMVTTGSGDINLDKLSFKSGSIISSGSGDIKVRVKENITISSSGSGDITVKGNPRVTQENTGSGNIIIL